MYYGHHNLQHAASTQAQKEKNFIFAPLSLIIMITSFNRI